MRERGLKFFPERLFADSLHVAPVRERGLKCAVRIAQAKAHLASLP